MLMRNCLLQFMTFGCPRIDFEKVGNYDQGSISLLHTLCDGLSIHACSVNADHVLMTFSCFFSNVD